MPGIRIPAQGTKPARRLQVMWHPCPDAATTARPPKKGNTPHSFSKVAASSRTTVSPGRKQPRHQPDSNSATAPSRTQITAPGKALADELSHVGMSTKSQGLSLKMVKTCRGKSPRTLSPNNHRCLRMRFISVCVGSEIPLSARRACTGPRGRFPYQAASRKSGSSSGWRCPAECR